MCKIYNRNEPPVQIAYPHTVHCTSAHARIHTHGSPTYQPWDDQSPDPLRGPPPWRRKCLEQLELCPAWPAVTPPTLLELCRAWPAVTPSAACLSGSKSTPVLCRFSLATAFECDKLGMFTSHWPPPPPPSAACSWHAYSYIQQSGRT